MTNSEPQTSFSTLPHSVFTFTRRNPNLCQQNVVSSGPLNACATLRIEL
jgi:hypothetical protein